jgi:hypothetical protein
MAILKIMTEILIWVGVWGMLEMLIDEFVHERDKKMRVSLYGTVGILGIILLLATQ